jgi:hypothetical protein
MSPTKSWTSEDPIDLLLLRELELDRELDEFVDREPLLNVSPPPGRADKSVSLGTGADEPCVASVGIAHMGCKLPVVDPGAARATVAKAVITKVIKMAAADRAGSSRRPRRRCMRRECVGRLVMRAARPGAR